MGFAPVAHGLGGLFYIHFWCNVQIVERSKFLDFFICLSYTLHQWDVVLARLFSWYSSSLVLTVDNLLKFPNAACQNCEAKQLMGSTAMLLEDTVTNQGDTMTKEGLRSKKSQELVGKRMCMFFALLT
jgi:hypothetical protein